MEPKYIHKKNQFNNAESTHYYDGNKTIYSRFNKVFIHNQKNLIEIKIPIKFWKRIIGHSRILRRLLRIDQYTIKLTNRNNLVIINDGKVYYYDGTKKKLTKTLKLKQCNQLLKNSICITPENEIIFGEYGTNKLRKSIPIYKSKDGGKSWKTIYEILPKKARHVHGCFWDDYEKKIWILTGDIKDENHFIKSDTNFNKIEWIGDGSQTFRACNLFFTEKYIYWITDSELEQNYLIRLNRKTKKYKKIREFPGPVWYTKKIDETNYFASITCERGPGSHHKYGYIYHSKDLVSWQEVLREKKDIWPKKYFKNGVMSFSDGKQKIDNFEISGEGFINFDGCSKLFTLNNYSTHEIFSKKYISKNIYDWEKNYKFNKDRVLPKKFKDLNLCDIKHLISVSNKDLSYEALQLNEKILRYCEINGKMIFDKNKWLNKKNSFESLLILFLDNYLFLKDLRYLNILLKLIDQSTLNRFSKKINKVHFEKILDAILLFEKKKIINSKKYT